jgi:formylglycine-generating enzyme required for sulfatase activity
VYQRDLDFRKKKSGSSRYKWRCPPATLDASNLDAAPADEEWIVVPVNTGGMGIDAFAVMKYEAKAFNDAYSDSTIDAFEADANGQGVAKLNYVPVGAADIQPWRSINANDSATECESLGANYHLISNPEWMAIAREVEMQGANWTGGTVGPGCLFRGNSGETTCGYNSTTDPDSGTGRDANGKLVLSNVEEIFDLAGNVWEWTDWDKDTVGLQIAPDIEPLVDLVSYQQLHLNL